MPEEDKMTDERRAELKKKIDEMAQYELCAYWRFSPSGDEIFTDEILGNYFRDVLKEKGGFTPAISKSLGW